MKFKSTYLAIFSCLMVSSPAVLGELPTLQQPWLGYFIGLKESKFQFGVTTRGEAVFTPLKNNGEPVNIHNPIKVSFEVLETSPDGKVSSKAFKWEDLTSEQAATQDPKEPVTFTGKAAGDATFEVTIVPQRKGFGLTGRVLDKGSITNPLTFVVSTDFKPYQWGVGDAGGREAFDKKIKRDEIRLEPASGGREKHDLIEPVNPATAYPDGIRSAEFRIEGYQIDFVVAASENSKLDFKDGGEKPLSDGFGLKWTVKEGADPTKEMMIFSSK